MSEVNAAKARLRADAIAKRDALPAGVRRDGARRIAEAGLGFVGPPAERIVSGYTAIDAELDPVGLLEALHRLGHPLALPVIQPKGEPLRFRRWVPGEPLAERMWGIREPAPEAPEVEPDVLLVPLLAFDANGNRLGYGAGYYDRTLRRLRGRKAIVAIGVAYDEQQVERVPHQEWDQRLDWVLTPSGPRRLG